MKRICSLFFGLVLMGCHSTQRPNVAGENNAAVAKLNGEWQLEFISTHTDLKVLFPTALPDMTLNTDDSTITGHDGCNRYSGKLRVNGREFQVDPGSLMGTKMFCEGVEAHAFSGALGQVGAYTLTGNKLELISNGKVLLRFHRK